MLIHRIAEEFLLYEGLDITHNSILSSDKLNLWMSLDGKVSFEAVGVKINMYFRKEIQKGDLDNILKWANNMGYFPAVMILNSKFEKFNYDKVVKFLSRPEFLHRINFEPKFDPELLEQDIPDVAYHIAPTQNEERILKIGLAPRSKEKISCHPSRVYMASSIDGVETLANHPTFHKNESLTIFEIDIRGLKKIRKIRWFSDPNFDDEGGFYTYENIPPKYLTAAKRIQN
jgi:hypothetical protein